jgi:ubiquinone/menaquinone biosynthesis C-methylase UbiE
LRVIEVKQDKAISSSSTTFYFDAVAEEYPFWYQAKSPRGYALRVRQQRLLELLHQPRNTARILDVGCGTGTLARELLNLGYEYWGVDMSRPMIEQCRKCFAEDARASFAVADATRLAFRDEFFDAVICVGVIDRIPAFESAIKEMTRVVKRNGTLLISFPNLLSPYAFWKAFVFYPIVALLRPIYFRFLGRSQSSSLLSSFVKLHTARGAGELLKRYGSEITDVVFFNFNVFFSPLDELFPKPTLQVIERMEQLRFGRLKWMGSAFMLHAKRW